MGWLINGVWVSIQAVTAVVWLILTDDGQGNRKWVKSETIKQWIDTPESNRAIQVSAGGEQILVERPKTIERFDISLLMFSDTQQMVQPQKRATAEVAAPAAGVPAETMNQLQPGQTVLTDPAPPQRLPDGMLNA